MRSPSVTTMKRTSFSGQLPRISRSRPRALIGRYMPRAARKIWRELLARLADRRRIDERHVGGRVRHQDRVEQRLVARLQVGQHEVFLQIVVEIGDLGMPARDLQFDRGDGGRQQAFEAVGAALHFGERRALVQTRVMKKLVSGSVIRCCSGHYHSPMRAWFRDGLESQPRSAIIRLVLAMARAGFSPFGQALVQFMIVWQR